MKIGIMFLCYHGNEVHIMDVNYGYLNASVSATDKQSVREIFPNYYIDLSWRFVTI